MKNRQMKPVDKWERIATGTEIFCTVALAVLGITFLVISVVLIAQIFGVLPQG